MENVDGVNGNWTSISKASTRLSTGLRVRATGNTGKTWGFGNEENPSHRCRTILKFDSSDITTEGGEWGRDGKKTIEVFIPFDYSPTSECRASAQKEPKSMKKYNLAKVIETGTAKMTAHKAAIVAVNESRVTAVQTAFNANLAKIAAGDAVEVTFDTPVAVINDRSEVLRKSIETLTHCDGTDVEDCNEVQNILADLPVPQTFKKLTISLR